MILVTLGSLEVPLYVLSIIGFGLAVYIDREMRKPKYAKNWDDGLVQIPNVKTGGSF